MERPLRILVCSGEAMPYAKTGGLADVAGSLPRALNDLGADARLALPKYQSLYQAGTPTEPLYSNLTVPLAQRHQAVGIEYTESGGMPTYLVVSDHHFRRPSGLYGYPDDAERFIVFMRGVLEMLARSDWRPDLIHCNDWQTGLIPVYLRTRYRDPLGEIASLYTVHNLAYQGNWPPAVLEPAGLDQSLFNPHQLEFYGQVSFMKAGLVFADAVSTVSPTYAREITQPEFGEGLDGVLRDRQSRLFGLLNAIDYDYWNPATDPSLTANYAPDTVESAKPLNKDALQAALGLERRAVPVLAIISRLTSQKGLDLVEQALPTLMARDFQFVVLGTGDAHYEQALRDTAARFPGRVAVTIGFDEPLAHLIYAGSDLFLMPSRYEPCGLGQMISMRYGTIPVVRRTGGLADTVQPFAADRLTGNGFVFADYTPQALAGAVTQALDTYAHPELWSALVANAMTTDFSWERSAGDYLELYRTTITLHASPVAV